MRRLTLGVFAVAVLGVGAVDLVAQMSPPGARAAVRTGRYDDALAAYAEAAENTNSAEVLREYARVLITVGRYEDAVDLLADAGGDPRSPAVAYELGRAYRARGLLAEAEAAFRSAAGSGAPDRNLARFQIGVLLEERGEREAALEIFDSFIDLYNGSDQLPAPDLIAVGRAVTHLAVTNPDLYKDALLAFDQAVEAAPSDQRPLVLLGDLFLRTYQSLDAQESYDALLELNPNHPGALFGKARALDFDGRGGAIEPLRRALEINPEYTEARAFLARLLIHTEGYGRALEEAERAVESNPNHLGALSVLAATHYFRAEMEEYERVRDRVLELHPTYPELYTTVAELAERQRRYATAVEFASRAVELDPASSRALGVLGMNQLRTGLIQEGRATLEDAFERDPYNPWYKNNLDLLDTFPFYETVRTEHFELFLHGREAELMAPYVSEVAEEAYAALAARYRTEPPLPVRVEVFPSHSDFSVRTLGLVGLGALGVSFGSVLVMDSPSARPPGDFNWASTFWHELAHAFHLGMTDHRVPRWFSEGLAVHEQRIARDWWGLGPDPAWLQSYAADRMPPVSRLNEGFVRPDYPEQVIHAYYQASLVFEMLEEEWGFDAVLAMLDGYREGRETPELVDEVLGLDSGELDERFDEYVRARFGDRMAAVDPLNNLVQRGDVASLRQDVVRAPGSFEARLRLGAALHAEEELDEAEEHLAVAHELFPEYGGDASPLIYLADIYETRGDLRAAAEALHEAGLRNESALEAYSWEARLRRELGEVEAEVAALEKAVLIAPPSLELHERLAEAYRDAGLAEGEVRERGAILALDPVDRAAAEYHFADALHRAGDDERARTHVLRALEIAPTYDEALELLLAIRGGGV